MTTIKRANSAIIAPRAITEPFNFEASIDPSIATAALSIKTVMPMFFISIPIVVKFILVANLPVNILPRSLNISFKLPTSPSFGLVVAVSISITPTTIARSIANDFNDVSSFSAGTNDSTTNDPAKIPIDSAILNNVSALMLTIIAVKAPLIAVAILPS